MFYFLLLLPNTDKRQLKKGRLYVGLKFMGEAVHRGFEGMVAGAEGIWLYCILKKQTVTSNWSDWVDSPGACPRDTVPSARLRILKVP